jgi:hypothetical protein
MQEPKKEENFVCKIKDRKPSIKNTRQMSSRVNAIQRKNESKQINEK